MSHHTDPGQPTPLLGVALLVTQAHEDPGEDMGTLGSQGLQSTSALAQPLRMLTKGTA